MCIVNPIEVDNTDPGDFSTELTVEANRVYLAGGTSGLRIYDSTDPEHIEQKADIIIYGAYWSMDKDDPIYLLLDENNNEVSSNYLTTQDNEIRLTCSVMPSMLTINEAAIRQDCLGYFMERYPLPV